MPRKARVVYRKRDGLCLESPTRPPCLARPDMITDRRLIDRQIIPEHGGKRKDYVVVEFGRSSKKPPWDFKWTPKGLVPATDALLAVREWREARPDREVMARIQRRRLEHDLELAESAGDSAAALYVRNRLTAQ